MPPLSSRTMSADDAVEPLERLLNLVGLLLETPTPLTFDQIRATLDGYRGDNLDSVKRKFERDKDMLRAYGVPLEMTGTDVWDVEQGYIIPKDRYYLPEIAFSPEEITALYLAAQSGTEATDVAQGVRKLLYGADGGVLAGVAGNPLAVQSDTEHDRLVLVAGAASERRRIRFGYRTAHGDDAEREVDAFGVVFRGGHWYLVGHDQARAAVRAFRVSRLTSDPVDVGPGAEPPEGFHAIEHVEAGPWNGAEGARGRVAFGPAAALLAEASTPGAARVSVRDDGWVVLSIPAAGLDDLAMLVLGYGPEAEALEPPELRRAVRDRLEAICGG
jgi:proteasome accessory factor B